MESTKSRLVRGLFERTKPAAQETVIPARPRLGIIKRNGRNLTANICLRRSTEEGKKKLFITLNRGGVSVFNKVKDALGARRFDVGQALHEGAELRELRARNGVGRPPKDKSPAAARIHQRLIDEVNMLARAERAAREIA